MALVMDQGRAMDPKIVYNCMGHQQGRSGNKKKHSG